MKRIIYTPAVGEEILTGSISYTLPVSGEVIDAIVPDDFATAGIVRYDSAAGIKLSEPHYHHFAGWEA